MQVEQRHVTTIRLHDAKGSDFFLLRDGRDYQLRIVSDEDVVNIQLTLQDLHRLSQQLIQASVPVPDQFRPPVKQEAVSYTTPTPPARPHWALSDWLGFN
jgi:hypothetical protein